MRLYFCRQWVLGGVGCIAYFKIIIIFLAGIAAAFGQVDPDATPSPLYGKVR